MSAENSQNSEELDEVMCMCSGTKRSYIKRLFESGLDIEAISRKTGALSGCGGCEWDIEEYVRELGENSK